MPTAMPRCQRRLASASTMGEWVSAAQMPYWQQLPTPWIRSDWDTRSPLAHRLYDRPTAMRIRQAATSFQRRCTYRVVGSRTTGQGRPEFAPKRVRWVNSRSGRRGFPCRALEIEAFPPAEAGGDFVSQVDPFIETTKGLFLLHHGQPAIRHDRRRTADLQPQPVRRGWQLQF